MKKLLVVIFLFFSLVTSATNYYVSNSGSDSNSGKSSSRPWLTLSKVNDHKFSPGDIIHFKRGDTFRGFLYIDSDINGTSGNPITFDAYGTGAKPRLWGSKDYSSSTQWTLSSGNIWVTTNAVTIYTDISNLIFNNEAAYGAKKSTLAGCTTQGDWFLNTSDKKVYLFSASNPGSYYLHIEVGGAYVNAGGYSVEEVIKLNSADYITIRNLDVRYSPNNGIAFMYGCTYCVVEYCDISWVGGMYVSGSTTTRMGNGLHIWVAADNIIWRYNIINQCFDAGVSPQGSGTYTQSNIDIYCNIITNCYYSYEIFTRTNNTITNVNFYNNTCINAGSQWSQFQRGGGGSDEHLRNSQTGATFSGYRIKNNIFYGSVTRAIQTDVTSGLDMDYNLYYGNPVIGQYSDTTYTTLAQWIAGTPFDDHSVSGNPLFVSSSDFRLQSSSPAIDAGVNVGLPYVSNAPDIGAFETVPFVYPYLMNNKISWFRFLFLLFGK